MFLVAVILRESAAGGRPKNPSARGMLRFAQHDNRVQEFAGQLKAKVQGASLVQTLRKVTEAVEQDACGAAHS